MYLVVPGIFSLTAYLGESIVWTFFQSFVSSFHTDWTILACEVPSSTAKFNQLRYLYSRYCDSILLWTFEDRSSASGFKSTESQRPDRIIMHLACHWIQDLQTFYGRPFFWPNLTESNSKSQVGSGHSRVFGSGILDILLAIHICQSPGTCWFQWIKVFRYWEIVGRETVSIMAETGNPAEDKKTQHGMCNGDHRSPQQCRHERMYVANSYFSHVISSSFPMILYHHLLQKPLLSTKRRANFSSTCSSLFAPAFFRLRISMLFYPATKIVLIIAQRLT